MITIELSEQAGAQSEAIADDLTRQGRLTAKVARRRPRILTVAEPGEGCACSLLTDEADWNAPTWEMTSLALSSLAKLVETLYASVDDGFLLRTTWIGEKSDSTETVSPGEMVQIIKQGRIGTKTEYRIS